MNGLIQFLQLMLENLKKKLEQKRIQRAKKKKHQIVVNLQIKKIVEKRPDVKLADDVFVLPTNSVPAVNYFLNTNLDIAFKYLMERMKTAVNKNLPVIDLFRIGQTPHIARIEKKDFEKYILEMQQYYVKSEEYEQAERCNQLLDRHRVNVNLDSQKK